MKKKKIITISEYFKLDKTQYELDFFDTNVYLDTQLFIDPWAIRCGGDDFSISAYQKVNSVFEKLIILIKDKKEDEALDLLDNLHEPSETGLGYASKSKAGSSVGKEKSEQIYNALLKSKAVRTGLLKDLEDTALHIKGIARDTISDIVTNIIRQDLIIYTQQQCDIHGLPLVNTQTKTYWDETQKDFVQSNSEKMLVVEGKKVLLIPKRILRRNLTINYSSYYNLSILEFEQARLYDARDSLCKTLKDEKNTLVPPTKKAIIESGRFPLSRELVLDYIKKHPETLENFKRKKAEAALQDMPTKAILEKQKRERDFDKLIKTKIAEFKQINSGKPEANAYHDHIYSCLNIIFNEPNNSNYLNSPKKEDHIHSGRKKVDITFYNNSDGGFFSKLGNYGGLFCAKIMFECKNYTHDIKNPEYDQLAGRFNNRESTIGYMVCRNIEDKEKAVKTCKDHLRDRGAYIMVLTDDDVIKLLEATLEKNRDFLIDEILQKKLNELVDLG